MVLRSQMLFLFCVSLGKAFNQCLVSFRIFPLFLIFYSLKMRCISVCFCIYPAWCSGFPSWVCCLTWTWGKFFFFLGGGKFLVIIASNISFFPFHFDFFWHFYYIQVTPPSMDIVFGFFQSVLFAFWFQGFWLYVDSSDKLSLFVSSLISPSKAFSFLLQGFFFNLQH